MEMERVEDVNFAIAQKDLYFSVHYLSSFE